METSQSSSIRQPLLKWLKNSFTTGSSGLQYSQYCSRPLSLLWFHVLTRISTWTSRPVFANRVVAFLALKKALVRSSILNNRIYLAFLLFCVSPFAFTLHVPFDREIKYGWM